MIASNTSNTLNFLVAVSLGENRWKKVGLVATANNRTRSDKDLKVVFPVNTKGHEEIKKACKWLANETAVSVDFNYRGMTIRVTRF